MMNQQLPQYDEIAEVPELAMLATVQVNLEILISALVAIYQGMDDGEGPLLNPPHKPEEWLADSMISQARIMIELIERYRRLMAQSLYKYATGDKSSLR